MVNQLADLRTDIENIDQAKILLAELAGLETSVVYAEAQLEKTIAGMKMDLEVRTADTKAAIADRRDRLLKFIVANKHLFKKPRTVKTASGSFGLQQATKISITNAAALVSWLMDKGYEDCLKVTRTVIKGGITARIVAEEKVPFVTVPTGDIAVYSIAKELLEEARKKA